MPTIPGYFVGTWFEIEGPDRLKKGVWRIAKVNGTTVTLEPKPTQPFTIQPGDRWRGIYRFDAVTVATGAVLVSTDPVIQLVPPLPEGSKAGVKSITSADYEALYGNDEAPAWNKSAVALAVGTVPGSYRITVGPAALSDPDGISEVRLTSGGRSLSADWTTEGVSFLWAGRPGQRLHLVATDAHGRFRRSGWLEMPPLPEAGWAAQLELAAGVTPLAVTGGIDWLAIGDDGVWLYGMTPEPVSVLPPRAANEEVVALSASGNLLFAATRERVDVVERIAETLQEVPVPQARVLDVAAGDGEATLLIADDSDPAQPALRLLQVLLPEGEAPTLSVPGDALPFLGAPALQRTRGISTCSGCSRTARASSTPGRATRQAIRS